MRDHIFRFIATGIVIVSSILFGCGDQSEKSTATVSTEKTLTSLIIERSLDDATPSAVIELPFDENIESFEIKNDDSIIPSNAKGEDISTLSRQLISIPLISPETLRSKFNGEHSVNIIIEACHANECVRYIQPITYRIISVNTPPKNQPQLLTNKVIFFDDIDWLPRLENNINEISNDGDRRLEAEIHMLDKFFSINTAVDNTLTTTTAIKAEVCNAQNLSGTLFITECNGDRCEKFSSPIFLTCHSAERSTTQTALDKLTLLENDSVTISHEIVLSNKANVILKISHKNTGVFSSGEEPIFDGNTVHFSREIFRRDLTNNPTMFTDEITVHWCDSNYISCGIHKSTFEQMVDGNRAPINTISQSEFTTVRNQPLEISSIASSDPDNDAIFYEWKIFAEPDDSKSIIQFDPKYATASFTPTHLGKYTLQLTATDSAAATTTSSVYVTTLNQLPSFSHEWYPATIYSDTDLEIHIKEIIDPDGDTVNVDLSWYVNGAEIKSVKSNMLNSQHYKKHDSISVIVKLDDGNSVTEHAIPPITVSNSIPVTNTDNWPNTYDITASKYKSLDFDYKVSAFDADGDALSITVIDGPTGMSSSSKDLAVRWQPTIPMFTSHLDVNLIFEISDGESSTLASKTVTVFDDDRRALPPVVSSNALASTKLKRVRGLDSYSSVIAYSESTIELFGFSDQFTEGFGKILSIPFALPTEKNIVDVDVIRNDDNDSSTFIVAFPDGLVSYNSRYGRFDYRYPETPIENSKVVRQIDAVDINRDGVLEIVLYSESSETSSTIEIIDSTNFNLINTIDIKSNITYEIENFSGDQNLDIMTSEGELFIFKNQFQYTLVQTKNFDGEILIGSAIDYLTEYKTVISSKNNGTELYSFSPERDNSVRLTRDPVRYNRISIAPPTYEYSTTNYYISSFMRNGSRITQYDSVWNGHDERPLETPFMIKEMTTLALSPMSFLHFAIKKDEMTGDGYEFILFDAARSTNKNTTLVWQQTNELDRFFPIAPLGLSPLSSPPDNIRFLAPSELSTDGNLLYDLMTLSIYDKQVQIDQYNMLYSQSDLTYQSGVLSKHSGQIFSTNSDYFMSHTSYYRCAGTNDNYKCDEPQYIDTSSSVVQIVDLDDSTYDKPKRQLLIYENGDLQVKERNEPTIISEVSLNTNLWDKLVVADSRVYESVVFYVLDQNKIVLLNFNGNNFETINAIELWEHQSHVAIGMYHAANASSSNSRNEITIFAGDIETSQLDRIFTFSMESLSIVNEVAYNGPTVYDIQPSRSSKNYYALAPKVNSSKIISMSPRTGNIIWQSPDLIGNATSVAPLVHYYYNPHKRREEIQHLFVSTSNAFYMTYDVLKAPTSDSVYPVANIVVSSSVVSPNEEVFFDSIGSSDVDGHIQSTRWSSSEFETDLFNGSFSTSFESPGQFLITLTVTDNDNLTNSASHVITVLDSKHTTMHLAGSFNNWSLTSDPMTLIDNSTWEATVTTNQLEDFKFVPVDWEISYGDNDSDGIADNEGGGNIDIPSAGTWKITFNDNTLEYTIEALEQ